MLSGRWRLSAQCRGVVEERLHHVGEHPCLKWPLLPLQLNATRVKSRRVASIGGVVTSQSLRRSRDARSCAKSVLHTSGCAHVPLWWSTHRTPTSVLMGRGRTPSRQTCPYTSMSWNSSFILATSLDKIKLDVVTLSRQRSKQWRPHLNRTSLDLDQTQTEHQLHDTNKHATHHH